MQASKPGSGGGGRLCKCQYLLLKKCFKKPAGDEEVMQEEKPIDTVYYPSDWFIHLVYSFGLYIYL